MASLRVVGWCCQTQSLASPSKSQIDCLRIICSTVSFSIFLPGPNHLRKGPVRSVLVVWPGVLPSLCDSGTSAGDIVLKSWIFSVWPLSLFHTNLPPTLGAPNTWLALPQVVEDLDAASNSHNPSQPLPLFIHRYLKKPPGYCYGSSWWAWVLYCWCHPSLLLLVFAAQRV